MDISPRATENLDVRKVLVVPCFNEENRLDRRAFVRAAESDRALAFIFVNDGSGDGTSAVLHALAAELGEQGAVVDLERNSGKAEAVRAGFLEALKRHDAELIGFWDADLATPLEELSRYEELFASRPALEMVIGSRVKLMGRDIARRASRHYLGRVAATGISLVLGLAIYDTQCGAKVFRVNDALREAMREPFVSRWLFDVEIIARYIRFHRRRSGEGVHERIYELPLFRWTDVAGSKVRGKDFARAAWDLGKIARRYPRNG